MAYRFRGRDRRLITKAKNVLKAIVARDVKALDTAKKTTSLSTRMLILDNDPVEGGLLFDANELIAWLNAQQNQHT